MPGFIGGRRLICAVCQRRILASDARLHYRGYYTCSDDWEDFPELFMELPPLPEMGNLPAHVTAPKRADRFTNPRYPWGVIDLSWDEIDTTWEET